MSLTLTFYKLIEYNQKDMCEYFLIFYELC
jgi:hypothetical protein